MFDIKKTKQGKNEDENEMSESGEKGGQTQRSDDDMSMEDVIGTSDLSEMDMDEEENDTSGKM